MKDWGVAFGIAASVGFLGASLVFGTIFTVPPELASTRQIDLMCWAFASFASAFSAGAAFQVVTTLTRPTVDRDQALGAKLQPFFAIILYLCSALLLCGVLFLSSAILFKARGAGILAITLPILSVVLATGFLLVINYHTI